MKRSKIGDSLYNHASLVSKFMTYMNSANGMNDHDHFKQSQNLVSHKIWLGRVTLEIRGAVIGVYQHLTVTDPTEVVQSEYQARFMNVRAPLERAKLEVYKAFYYDAVIAFKKEPRNIPHLSFLF